MHSASSEPENEGMLEALVPIFGPGRIEARSEGTRQMSLDMTVPRRTSSRLPFARRYVATTVVVASVLFMVAWLHAQDAWAQTTVLSDSFEAGVFSSDWDTTSGTGTSIVSAPGDGAIGSNFYARVAGVAVGQGGLGVTFDDLFEQPFVQNFSLQLDFRIDAVPSGSRQFNVSVSTGSAAPKSNAANLNLRYQGELWQAYNGAWTTIAGLTAITPDTWNTLILSGSDWGTGIPGTASYDITVIDHLGNTRNAMDLQIFQGGSTVADTNGAMSLSINDTYGNNPGFDVDNVMITAEPTVTVTPVNPVAYSGIYPHLAVTNTHPESGIGGLISREGKIFYITYGPNFRMGSSDKLYAVDTANLSHTTYLNYPGNTDANRYSDSVLGIDVIGAAYIDDADTVRFLNVTSPGGLLGRITGTAAHLTSAEKLYYMTMEEGLYEVDFSRLDDPIIITLRVDGHDSTDDVLNNLPGVHGKGLHVGQGHLFYTNNGSGQGAPGALVEWDGLDDPKEIAAWTIVDDTSQYTEVTSRRGPVDMSPDSTDAVWALGWDDASVLLNVRTAATGQWTKFRLPKGSYTHDGAMGWFTEWPRIRNVGRSDGALLLNHHGMLYLLPETFSMSNTAGIVPISTFHKMITDYVDSGDQIVFAANDASKFANPLVPTANSNLVFVDKAELTSYGGNPRGAGGVWVNDFVAARTPSDPLLINGFANRVLHLLNNDEEKARFLIERKVGDQRWKVLGSVQVPPGKYAYELLPADIDAEWIRLSTNRTLTSATAYAHLSNPPDAPDLSLIDSIADPAEQVSRSQGLLRNMANADFKLEFAADVLDATGTITGRGYYRAQLDETTQRLEIVKVEDAEADANLRSEAATTLDFGVDSASVFVDDGGIRYRLPKGDSAFDSATASGWRRGIREVVTERSLMNIHGTFYELPRDSSGAGMRRIRPITTHDLDIFDYASWRGMLVLSGNVTSAFEGDHFVRSDDEQVGLWFGNVDDLWRFGGPRGEGGPWFETPVAAGEASDPYLMYGYHRKTLELSHTSDDEMDFTIEVDFLGDGSWNVYEVVTVDEDEVLVQEFPIEYSAHWVRLRADSATTATAWFTYEDD